jgi:phosphatidylglycerophosphate synthase
MTYNRQDMMPVYSFLDAIKVAVKRQMLRLAKVSNKLSRGRITANHLTFISLGMHVVIAALIAQGSFVFGATLLVIFGLFDALDGELARLQGTAGTKGMLLDSVTDKMKEIILYIGVSYAFVDMNLAFYAVWAVAACGSSLLVSYVNAWGEVVMARRPDDSRINQAFRGGLMRYEVRMFVLVVGLLVERLPATVAVIAVLSSLTAIERLVTIRRQL